MRSATLADALAALAWKRRLLDRHAARRLGDLAAAAGIASLAELYGWLADAQGISAELSRRLFPMLAPLDQEAFGGRLAIAVLAEGGMGRVWLAAEEDGPLTVIKTQRRLEGGEGAARFERETRIHRRLEHENLVRCLDSGLASDGSPFLVLEYVDAGDLRDLVESRGSLPEPLALAILHQAASGLAEAHRLGIVHRDVKPANIFIGADGSAKLADFGIARAADGGTQLTMQGAMVGSPHFMAPEQIRGEVVDIRSDIYAFGAVLHYALCGRPPYEGTIQEVLHGHCAGVLPDWTRLPTPLSPATVALLASCLAKAPAERPRDPVMLMESLGAALAGLGMTVAGVIEEETRDGWTDTEGPSATGPLVPLTASDAAAPTIVHCAAASRHSAASSMQMVTASLLHTTALRPAPVQKVPAAGSSTDGRVGVTPSPAGLVVNGDLDDAIADDWICLEPLDAGDPTLVVLYARLAITLGKLRESPVDLPLRNYPVAAHKDALQRISRQHLRLLWDAVSGQFVVEDLGGPNGSLLDGVPLVAGQAQPLGGASHHVLVAASAVNLWLNARRAREGALALPSDCGLTPGPCGLDRDHAMDALVITRPENRPEAAYALVLRRLSIGGPGSDLALPGARSVAATVFALAGGRWLARVPGAEAWRPLVYGSDFDCGGRRLRVVPAGYERF